MNIRTFVAFVSQNLQYNFPKTRGGGSKAIWNFSEKTSVLVLPIVPKACLQSLSFQGHWGQRHLQTHLQGIFQKFPGMVSRCSQAAHHPPLRPPIIIICISTKLYTVHHVVQYVQRFKVVQHMCANHLIIFSQTIEHFGWYDAFLGWRLFTKALYWSTFFCGRVISQCKLSNGLYLLQLTLCTALC